MQQAKPKGTAGIPAVPFGSYDPDIDFEASILAGYEMIFSDYQINNATDRTMVLFDMA